MSASEQRLRDLVTEVTGRDASGLGLDDDLVERLALDSLRALQVLAMVEKRFGVRIPDSRLGAMRTLGALLSAIDGDDGEVKP